MRRAAFAVMSRPGRYRREKLSVVRGGRLGARRLARLGTAILPAAVMVSVAAAFWPGVAGATTAPGWTLQSTPNPPGATNSHLSGVSCTVNGACTAVGRYTDSAGTTDTLAERWDGSSWTIESTPNPPGSKFNAFVGVSCTSDSACTAVGNYADSAGTTKTLAERWNGSSWTIESTPNPATSTQSEFASVSCTSASTCTAVGIWYNLTHTQGQTLAERSNGSNWTIQRTPSPPGGVLLAVSCTSATVCVATGNSYRSLENSTVVTLAERRNAMSWQIQFTSNPPGSFFSNLYGVSCTTVGACTAVGFSDNGSSVTLAERWDGKSWSIQPTPVPTGATNSYLQGVSCTALSACTTVGESFDSIGTEATLAERWDGATWSIQPTPNASGATNSSLSGVSCTANGTCTAVGSSSTGGSSLTLAERYS